MHRRKIMVLAATGALAVPAGAEAHVTLQPTTAAAGAFTVLDIRVPNERDKASTVKVDVRFPAGFAAVSYQPVSGWKVKVIKKKLATPIQTDDGPVTEGVSRMIWTGARKGLGKIAPGQFMDFPISVQIPGKAGDVLTFKALQTYSNGEVVRWIGPPHAEAARAARDGDRSENEEREPLGRGRRDGARRARRRRRHAGDPRARDGRAALRGRRACRHSPPPAPGSGGGLRTEVPGGGPGGPAGPPPGPHPLPREERQMKLSISRASAAPAVLAASALLAVPALAHAPVTGTSPKDGSTHSKVRTVSVRFGEAVVTGKITVYRASGTAVAARTSGLAPKNKALLRAIFSKNLASGKYTVKWRALADDGHHEKGTFRFRVS